MLTITIPDLDVTTGSIPLTWCLDIEGVKKIMDSYKVEPNVLIVIAPQNPYHKYLENRYVVPLKDVMTYVSFRKPGKNKIFVLVFDEKDKELKTKYLSKYAGKFQFDILDYEGNNFIDSGDLKHYSYYKLPEIRVSIDVDVPAEAFAPEPAQWEKDWVLWLLPDKGVDQCDFRKRRIFAYTIQPFVFAINYLIRILFTFISASLLLRSFSFDYLKSPLCFDLDDCIDLWRKESILLKDSESSNWKNTLNFKSLFAGTWNSIKKFGGLVFLPLLWAVILPLAYNFGFSIIKYYFLIIASMAFFTFIICFIITLITSVIGLIYKKSEVKERKVEQDKSLFNKRDIEYITCNPVNTLRKNVSVAALPAPKRTLKLRFQQIKSKVCRPFPG